MIQGGRIALDDYLLPDNKVDVDKFIAETIADVECYGSQQITEEDNPLVTVLYHLNYLPEYLGAKTFEYRHKFRDCLYSQDNSLREKCAAVYYRLLSGTLDQAEAIATIRAPDLFPGNPSVLEQSYKFDQLRQMVYEDVVHGSILAPALRVAIGLVLERKKEDPTPEDAGPEFCW